MTAVVSVDVSEFQAPVNDTYPHNWLSFRLCDGNYVDAKAATNLAWALKARASGRLENFTVYVVYRPGENSVILSHLNTLRVPTDCVVMIDAESWNGAIAGDHSGEINQLADMLATRQGSRSRVWAYGNRGPDLTVWPNKPSWIGWVVASYGEPKPTGIPNMIGWQYTDGQYQVTGLPSSSAPFGPCDHNQFYITTGEEDDVALTASQEQALSLDETHPASPSVGAIHKVLVDLRSDATHDNTIPSINRRLDAIEAALANIQTGGIDPAAVAAAIAEHVAVSLAAK